VGGRLRSSGLGTRRGNSTSSVADDADRACGAVAIQLHGAMRRRSRATLDSRADQPGPPRGPPSASGDAGSSQPIAATPSHARSARRRRVAPVTSAHSSPAAESSRVNGRVESVRCHPSAERGEGFHPPLRVPPRPLIKLFGGTNGVQRIVSLKNFKGAARSSARTTASRASVWSDDTEARNATVGEFFLSCSK
jgi:hypothetical protein